MTATYFQGSGYNSRGQKSERADEICRNCREPYDHHYNGICPCDECGEAHIGACPEKKRRK